MKAIRGKKGNVIFPAECPMWSAHVPLHISLFIMRWSIIFPGIRTVSDRHKNLFRFLTAETLNCFHVKSHRRTYDVPGLKTLYCECFLQTKMLKVYRACAASQLSAEEVLQKSPRPKLQNKPLLKHFAHCSKIKGILGVTSMKDLMEKRLASMVDRPWARQLWAMNPAFSSARQIASSPSFQFQLGMFSRWAFVTVREREEATGWGKHIKGFMSQTEERLRISQTSFAFSLRTKLIRRSRGRTRHKKVLPYCDTAAFVWLFWF